MQINASRQQVLQEYAKARQATYQRLNIPGVFLLSLALVQLPCFTLLQLPGSTSPASFSVFNRAVHALFQPLSWQPLPGWYPLQVLVYYALVSLILEIIYVPVAFRIEYTIPRRLKLGTRTSRTTLTRIVQKQGMLVARWAVLIEVFYLLFALQPLLWWIEMALLMSVLAFIEHGLGPAKIRRLFAVSALPEGALKQRLRALLEQFSLPAQEIVVIDKPGAKMEANAYIAGFGKSRLIGISSTMLKEFSPDEVEVLFAHELGHHVHHDFLRKPGVWLGIRLLGYGIIALVLAVATVTAGSGDITTLPLFVIAHILFWLNGSTSFYKFSRRCEYEADEFALQTTGLATAFKQAMIRLANLGLVVANPEKNTATHPPLVSRIQHAEEFATRTSNARMARM
ncbi:MAG TPA: M48 family metalloprotease [Ktedonobacteraceae bacterium]|nr:M48 family metalloprotease [Ktedonobacteraceae bacterium]